MEPTVSNDCQNFLIKQEAHHREWMQQVDKGQKLSAILAVDQSYTRSGFAVIVDDERKYVGKVERWYSLPLPTSMTRTQKRACVRYELKRNYEQYQPEKIVIERVRLHREGKLNILAAVALATLTASILDFAHEHHIPVYSLDTRSWKSATLGSANATKEDAVLFVQALIGKKVNHDAADAICMGLTGYQQPHLLKSIDV